MTQEGTTNADRELFQVVDDLRKSPGWRIFAHLEELTLTLGLHAANYRDLTAWTADLIGDSDENIKRILELWDVTNRTRLMGRSNETNRRLHNFLASAQTLVDHTRRLIRDIYADADFIEEYKAEVARRFAENPLCRFVQQLRNYNLHYEYPPITQTLNLNSPDEPLRSRIIIDIDAIRHWDKWDGPARTYIGSAQSEIGVGDLATEYMDVVVEFHQWLTNREWEMHRDELTYVVEGLRTAKELHAKDFPDISDRIKKRRPQGDE